MKKIMAVAVAAILVFSSAKPARSQAELLLPAACATGVGCVLIGTIVIAGVAYYVWQNNQTGQRYRMAIEDPEEEMERMGNNAQNGRIVVARSASVAHSRCAQLAGQRGTSTPENLGNNRWRCRYY